MVEYRGIVPGEKRRFLIDFRQFEAAVRAAEKRINHFGIGERERTQQYFNNRVMNFDHTENRVFGRAYSTEGSMEINIAPIIRQSIFETEFFGENYREVLKETPGRILRHVATTAIHEFLHNEHRYRNPGYDLTEINEAVAYFGTELIVGDTPHIALNQMLGGVAGSSYTDEQRFHNENAIYLMLELYDKFEERHGRMTVKDKSDFVNTLLDCTNVVDVIRVYDKIVGPKPNHPVNPEIEYLSQSDGLTYYR